MPPAEVLCAENLALQAELANLRAQLAWFQRQVFGKRTEKLPADTPKQSTLGLPETPAAEPGKQLVAYERRTPAPEKRPSPAEVFSALPVTETITLVPAEVRAEPEAFAQIGEERTFEVDLTLPRLVKRAIVRPKFKRKADRAAAPLIAPAPPRVATGGYASAGLIAHLVVSKYQHHLPLYRLETMSEQWGARLSRQSMAEWVRIAAEWAEPIYKLMHTELLRGRYVQCDETPVKFIDPDAKGRGAAQGYLWVVSAPGGDVVFDWRLSRRHGELTTLLTAEYAGLLQSDGYEAYAAYARTHRRWRGWAVGRTRAGSFSKRKRSIPASLKPPCA